MREIVRNCLICGKHTPLKKKGTFNNIIENEPFVRIMIDCVDLSSIKKINFGYCWLLTCIDVYSKFAWVFSLKNKTSKEITICLKELIYKEGCFKILQSDNGKEFINSDINILLQNFNIIHKRSRPRNPKYNGQIKRFNQTICRSLV